MKRPGTFAVAVTLAVSLAACGGADRREPTAVRQPLSAQWQDGFEGTPDLYVVVRPQAIKRDEIYGALWKTALRYAQAQRILVGPTALEAAEGAEEIIVGVEPGDDAAIVLRGVPASLDPSRMADSSGQPLFRLVSEHTRVPEYEPADGAEATGGLFVLPDRTWVVTLGDARVRAREAFAVPFGRPAPRVDPAALAVFRLGTAFVQKPRYTKSPVWGPLTRKLITASLALEPGKSGLAVTLEYDEEDGAAWAEMHAKRIVEELALATKRADPPPRPRPGLPPAPDDGASRFAWLEETTIAREGKAVKVKLALPPRLLEALPNVSPADLPL
jgi:hypothetical protein